MGLNPVVIENFPGLDLRVDPGDSRAAIDALNVSLLPGRVKTREGTSLFYTAPAAVRFLDVFNSVTAGRQLIAASDGAVNGTYSAVAPSGSLVASYATTTGIIDQTGASGVAIGTLSANAYYVTTARGSLIAKWTGSAWSTPAGMPASPGVLSISPTDNRLVVCDTGSKVWFSDPGAPETFGANNFVSLVPGDGESIQGAAVFANQLFVFKSTRFFVFYGNSTDASGNPVFNYRTITTGVGTQFRQLITPSSVCVGPDGVYFVSGTGVYRTTGGAPVHVSLQIQPALDGAANTFWQGGTWTPTSTTRVRLAWVGDRMFFSLPGIGTFVYDRRVDAWSLWTTLAQAITGFASSNADGALDAPFFGVASTVLKTDPTLATDSGSAIVSRYRFPFEDYGSPRRKRLRETIIEGTGTVTAQWSKDWGALTTGSSVVLGTSPAIATARQRLAMLGNSFSLQLGASSGAWAVNRVQANVSDALAGPEITV
jgi:hypothetical protein